MAIHSSMIAWKTPWTEEPGGLQSMGWQKGQTQLSNSTETTANKVKLYEFTIHGDVLVNVHQSTLQKGEGEPWFVAPACFHGVNTLTVAVFKLPVWRHWTRTWEVMHIIDSYELVGFSPQHSTETGGAGVSHWEVEYKKSLNIYKWKWPYAIR